MIRGQLFECSIWKQPFDFAPDRFIEPKIALSDAVVNQKCTAKLKIKFQIADFFFTERRKLLITRHVKKWIFKEAVIIGTNGNSVNTRFNAGALNEFPHQTLSRIWPWIPVAAVILQLYKSNLR